MKYKLNLLFSDCPAFVSCKERCFGCCLILSSNASPSSVIYRFGQLRLAAHFDLYRTKGSDP